MVAYKFDATTVEPFSSFQLLPAGSYQCKLVESVAKKTTDGSGGFIQLTFRVIDGECAGAKIIERLNVMNANAKAVEVAQRKLSSLCHACGVLKISDTSELHNIPVSVRVEIEEAPPEAKYGDSNRVTEITALDNDEEKPKKASAKKSATKKAAAKKEEPKEETSEEPPVDGSAFEGDATDDDFLADLFN